MTMNHKIIFLAAILAGTAFCKVQGEIQSFALTAGANAVGIALVKPAWLKGTIGAVDTKGLRLQDKNIPVASLSNSLQWETVPAYLEISSSPADPKLVGERYEVDVSSNPSANQGWIRLKAAVSNTRQDLPAGLAGATYSVRPHWTLANVFGTSAQTFVRSGRTSSSADEVQLANPLSGNLEGFFLSNDPISKGWRHSRNRQGPEQANVLILPGSGLLIHAKGPLVFSLSGEVRNSTFKLPLRAGPNFVSLGYMTSFRIPDLVGNSSTKFQAGLSPNLADRISLLLGTRMENFYLGPTGQQWVCSTSSYPTDVNEVQLFPPNRAFWIHKVKADPNFSIPAPR
jgi:hypothetical protein